MAAAPDDFPEPGQPTRGDVQYARDYQTTNERGEREGRLRSLRTPDWNKLRARMENVSIKRRAERGTRYISSRDYPSQPRSTR